MDLTPKKIAGTTIEGLKETPYLKLLHYAFEKAATKSSFTRDEACQATSLTQDDFNALKDQICSLIGDSDSDYSITQSSFLNYLQFVQFEEARAFAIEANGRALTAVRLAIAAIIVSILIAIPSLLPKSSAAQNLTLDQTQLEQIINKIDSSKLNTSDVNEIKGNLANIKLAIESQNKSSKSGTLLTKPNANK
ncbi:MAG: hypothetical protein QOF62_171 [Pyrinomonadaceae bacterium]|jgi:hypothetical protein|nr:hypothetical protein [Pyrinomonadaceae bacterium]